MRQYGFTTLLTALLGLALASSPGVSAFGQSITVWQRDVCEKIFPDSPVGDEGPIVFQAAGNEYESALIGLRSDVALENVAITVSNLTGDEQNGFIPSDNIRVREVGMLHINHNTRDAENIVTRKAPCDMPEILYDRSTTSLQPDAAQGVWLTLFVPQGTPAGSYSGTLTLTAGDMVKDVEIKAEIFPFDLPEKRNLYSTNWWSPGNIADQHKVDFLSDEYWAILEKYIQNMGEHRQNVLHLYWVPGNFVSARVKEDGSWTFDFSNLDRVIDLALKYGVLDRIELNHIGGINRTEHRVDFRSVVVYDERAKDNVRFGIDDWLEPTLKALCNRLRERGLFERAMIHVADEPYQPDVESWRAASEKIRAIEPELKQIDAIEAINFDDRLDVWVPKLNHFDRWREAFEARRDKGEFWYYICCHPTGETYPNRFMDLPAVRVRVLHWLNYSEDLVGYLHWGYNYWQGDPFGPPTPTYGPGDTHVVYPGDGGPLDSIRWEVERESAEDYEYLKLLEDKTAEFKEKYDPAKVWFLDPKARSKEIARRVVPSPSTSTLDYNVLNAARSEIVNEIKNVTGPVNLVVSTFPADNSTVFTGPTLFEIYGVTTPGAQVTVNDKPVDVDAQGFFMLNPALPAGEQTFEIVATLNGKTARTTRRFTVK